ncbi:MAG: toxin, partial [Myxococcota bacterium]
AELTEAQAHFFVVRRHEDPRYTVQRPIVTTVDYDVYDLMITEAIDPLGSWETVYTEDDAGSVAARLDYRLLEPYGRTDANGNRTWVAFDLLGRVVASAVQGKPGEGEGDTLDGLAIQSIDGETLYDDLDPVDRARTLIGSATTRTTYDTTRFWRTSLAHPDDPSLWEPSVIATIQRDEHDSTPTPGEPLPIALMFSFVDGEGRTAQQKVLSEAGPVPGQSGTVAERWRGTGWVIYDNQGRPVRTYEPFFSRLSTGRHRFEYAATYGVSAVVFRDPMGRPVATLHPTDAYDKHVIRAWHTADWDANDTVLLDPSTDPDVGPWMAPTITSLLARSSGWASWHAARVGGALGPLEQTAAQRTEAHAATPTRQVVDALGRTFLLARDLDGTQRATLHTVFDIQGRVLAVIDARDRIVERSSYDLRGTVLARQSLDAGERTQLTDVRGQTLRVWNVRGHQTRNTFDPLGRPLQRYVTGADASHPTRELLTQRWVWGEQHPEATARNLHGQLYLVLTGAGADTTERADFKGNPTEGTRRYALVYDAVFDWSRVDVLVPPPGQLLDLDALASTLSPRVEAETFRSWARFDARNRRVEALTPHTTTQPPNRLRFAYHPAGGLAELEVNLRGETDGSGNLIYSSFVTDTAYDAKGRRIHVGFGNGVSTSFTYDPLSSRLVHQESRRDPAAFPSDDPNPPVTGWPGRQVQNLRMTYDPVGNAIHVVDNAQQVGHLNRTGRGCRQL